MEGNYFYFFAWLGWIVATFFMKKTTVRLLAATTCLLLIIVSQTFLTIGPVRVWMGALILLIIGIGGISRFPLLTKLYYLLCTTIIGMVYATLHLIELYDPVWIIVDRIWLSAILIVYAAYMLVRLQMQRVLVVCTGAVQGDVLLAIVLEPYGFHNELGSMLFLDTVACSLFLLCTCTGVWKWLSVIELFKQKQVRERQG